MPGGPDDGGLPPGDRPADSSSLATWREMQTQPALEDKLGSGLWLAPMGTPARR